MSSPVAAELDVHLLSSFLGSINFSNPGLILWPLLIIGLVLYYIITKAMKSIKIKIKQQESYNPNRLSTLEDKLRQKRLLQQQSWNEQSSEVYETEKAERQAKYREKQAKKLNVNNNINIDEEDLSDNEELRKMLTKPDNSSKPAWLDSNFRSGNGSNGRNIRGLPSRGAGGCGPSS